MRNMIRMVSILALATITMGSCVSKKKYTAAMSSNRALQSKNVELQGDLTQANNKIDALQKEVSTLGSYYTAANTQLDLTQEQVKEQQERLMRMQRLIYEQHERTEALRKKMADALVNFKSEELSVFIKDGKVHVALQDNLLFPSGSAVVNEKGKTALAKLATVLKQNPQINVEVEGHTDNKPISTAKYPDNWALSVARATTIVRILTEDHSIEPTRVTASGHGEYMPVASNDSEAGRARNRRTEIILEPKLDELMNLIYERPTTISQE
ncbi:MAG TPA: OmpA family protein [Flavipsychrobacter sp.]